MRNLRMLWALLTNGPTPGGEVIERGLREVNNRLSVLEALVMLKRDMGG